MFFDPMYLLFVAPALVFSLDATRRAKRLMADYGILSGRELAGAARVLDAAAWTYIAAAAMAVLQLAYYLLRFGLLGGRRDD